MKPYTTCLAGVLALGCVASLPTQCTGQDSPPSKVFLIGNSLTWDTLPGLLDGNVQWHVDCGKNLRYIYEHPQKPCVRTSTSWNKALERQQFDVLCVQPHFGTTLQEDVSTISKWLSTQKKVKLVIHTGWSRHKDFCTDYESVGSDAPSKMCHTPKYFSQIEEKLRRKHPGLEVTSTHAIEVLHSICEDIESKQAPVEQLSDLYRDEIHVTTQAGRFLMHNLMRVAIGQKVSQQGFQVEQPLRDYLKAKVDYASEIRRQRLVSVGK